jgi:hypothetical protein
MRVRAWGTGLRLAAGGADKVSERQPRLRSPGPHSHRLRDPPLGVYYVLWVHHAKLRYKARPTEPMGSRLSGARKAAHPPTERDPILYTGSWGGSHSSRERMCSAAACRRPSRTQLSIQVGRLPVLAGTHEHQSWPWCGCGQSPGCSQRSRRSRSSLFTNDPPALAVAPFLTLKGPPPSLVSCPRARKGDCVCVSLSRGLSPSRLRHPSLARGAGGRGPMPCMRIPASGGRRHLRLTLAATCSATRKLKLAAWGQRLVPRGSLLWQARAREKHPRICWPSCLVRRRFRRPRASGARRAARRRA